MGFGLAICAEIGAVVRSLKRLVGKRDKLRELASYYQVIGTHDTYENRPQIISEPVDLAATGAVLYIRNDQMNMFRV